ncbi:MAG: LysM peptidoglycan-binding domain-containing protein [Limnochordia bacterium]|jgi:spore coat assembly protein SafA
MHGPRVPTHCPPGFKGRYTVVQGDTMFLIAQRFGVPLNALIAANPQIPNPNLIFPGDVLCVPGEQPSPPPKDSCPCPRALKDFLNRRVEVMTPCGVISGTLVSVGDDSLTLREYPGGQTIVIRCQEICFVRVLRHHGKGD